MFRSAVWDIECWDLGAEFGPLTCASVLLLPEEKMVTLRQDSYVRRKKASDMDDDRALLCDLRDLLNGVVQHAGWYTKGFDIPHVNTRLAMWGERLLESRLHVDGNWYFRGWRGLKPRSSKLKHVSEFFGFEQKPEVAAETWLKARLGQKKAVDEVCDRCEADVRITWAITEKMAELGLIRNIQRYP